MVNQPIGNHGWESFGVVGFEPWTPALRSNEESET